MWTGSRDTLLNFTPPEISLERLKLETTNFVHRLAKPSVSLYVTNFPPKWAWSVSRDLLKFWQLSVDISKTVQDRDIRIRGSTMMRYINSHYITLHILPMED